MNVGPKIHSATGELRAIVAGDPLREAAVVLHPVHRCDDMLSTQAEADFDTQALPRN